MDAQAGERNAHRAGAAQAPHWKFWFQWVLSSLAAGTVAAVLVSIGLATESALVGISAMFGILLVPGFVLGGLQFLVLRRHVAIARTWILITALGWGLGWAMGAIVGWVVAAIVGGGQLISITGGSNSEPWSGVVMFGLGGVIAGSVVGGLQLTLLRTHVARTGVWLQANAAAMAVGGVFVGLVMWWYYDDWGIGAVLASLLYGAITGYRLMQLLRKRGGEARDSTT